MIPAAELRRLSPLLDEALELPAADRLAWLERQPDIPVPLRACLRELLSPGCVGYVLPPLPRYDDISYPGPCRRRTDSDR